MVHIYMLTAKTVIKLISFCIYMLIFCSISVNNFSIISEQFPVFLDWTSNKKQIKCLAQGHNPVTQASLKHFIISLTLYQPNHCVPQSDCHGLLTDSTSLLSGYCAAIGLFINIIKANGGFYLRNELNDYDRTSLHKKQRIVGQG